MGLPYSLHVCVFGRNEKDRGSGGRLLHAVGIVVKKQKKTRGLFCRGRSFVDNLLPFIYLRGAKRLCDRDLLAVRDRYDGARLSVAPYERLLFFFAALYGARI